MLSSMWILGVILIRKFRLVSEDWGCLMYSNLIPPGKMRVEIQIYFFWVYNLRETKPTYQVHDHPQTTGKQVGFCPKKKVPQKICG